MFFNHAKLLILNYAHFLLLFFEFHHRDSHSYIINIFLFTDIPRLDKSPLLANGYNAPPTHLNPLQYMQMSHHPAANMLNSGISAHNLTRSDGVLVKGQSGLPGVDAIAR